jgi:hypothetical protein
MYETFFVIGLIVSAIREPGADCLFEVAGKPGV